MSVVYKNQEKNYLNPLSEVADKSLFMVFFLLGALFIVIFKLTYLPIQYIYAVPTGLMVVYATRCYFSPYFQLRLDKAGDNIYYLGFLYTLTSLAVSLYQSSHLLQNQDIIISNFGIALVTTIFGVAGRVLFTQLRDTPFEVEQEAVSSLTQSSRKLKGELNAILTDFNIFRTALNQSSGEWLLEWKNERESHLKMTSECIEENIRLVSLQNKNITNNIQELAIEIGKINEKIKNMDFSKDLFSKLLRGPVDKLNDLITEISNKLLKKIKIIEASSEGLINFVEKEKTFASIISNLEETATQQTELSKVIVDNIQQRLETFGTIIDKENNNVEKQTNSLVDKLKRLSIVYDDLTKNVVERNNDFTNSFNSFSDDLSASQTAIVSAVGQQTKILEKLVLEDLDKFSEVLVSRLSEISESSNVLKDLNQEEIRLARIVGKLAEHTDSVISISQNHLSTFDNGINMLIDSILQSTEKIDYNISNTGKAISHLVDKEFVLSNTMEKFTNFSNNLISSSEKSLTSVYNEMDGFCERFQKNTEKMGVNFDYAEKQIFQFGSIYEKVIKSTELTNVRLNNNVEVLNNKLKEAYSLLLKTVSYQNQYIQHITKQQRQIVSPSNNSVSTTSIKEEN